MGLLGVGAQQVQVQDVVWGVIEHLLTSIASLRDVVENVLQDNSGDSGHRTDSSSKGLFSQMVFECNVPSFHVPSFPPLLHRGCRLLVLGLRK